MFPLKSDLGLKRRGRQHGVKNDSQERGSTRRTATLRAQRGGGEKQTPSAGSTPARGKQRRLGGRENNRAVEGHPAGFAQSLPSPYRAVVGAAPAAPLHLAATHPANASLPCRPPAAWHCHRAHGAGKLQGPSFLFLH